MKKNIWIFNHYASDMYESEGGRHYSLAKELQNKGYTPVIFCASTFHSLNKKTQNINKKFDIKMKENILFVFVPTPEYSGNGFSRIRNMFSFYKNIKKIDKLPNEIRNPDIIYASSVHPLTLVAGIQVGKRFKVPCISEVRDLWPESLVAYGVISRNNPLTKILYKGERWIYDKSDQLIMTWEGGLDYIREQGWTEIKSGKVLHLSNGISLKEFHENSNLFVLDDGDLDDRNYFNIVYTGSIRKVNAINFLLDVAKRIQDTNSHPKIRFLIYGDGTELEKLKKKLEDEKIYNVLFKGRIEKKYVPSVLTRSGINILHNSSTTLDKYGQSQNKLFEYLAAGRPILQTYKTGYSILRKYDCGYMSNEQSVEEVADEIIRLSVNPKKCKAISNNAKNAAKDFDYSVLVKKLEYAIEKTNK